MNPLIAIAASLLPDILKAIVGRSASGDGDDIQERVADAVMKAARTGDPEQARDALDADPAAAAALRLRLAEIAAEEEERRRAAGLKEQELGLREAEARQSARMAELREEFAAEDRRRSAAFEVLNARMEDVRHARSSLAELARAGSPMAWGAPAVSVIVALGFFVILIAMIAMIAWPALPALESDSPVFQIINVAIGALATAFATVVSFWLGSSQGSRAKDAFAYDLREYDRARPARRGGGEADPDRPAPSAPPAAPRTGASNFQACVDIVLAHEGGYSDHPRDPGGATRFGITQTTLAQWRGRPVSKADVRRLGADEAREIYYANYWNALNCDALPPGVDLTVFDFGVNAGTGRAARHLQRIVASHADGVVGPATIEAVEGFDAAGLIRRFSAERLDYYRGLAGWNSFARGWTRRTRAVERAALAMLGQSDGGPATRSPRSR